jgi:putative FmdB family regulatory protein
MPYYTFKCGKCVKEHKLYLLVDKRDTPQTCPDCGENMTRAILEMGLVVDANSEKAEARVRLQTELDRAKGRLKQFTQASREEALSMSIINQECEDN